MQVKTLYRRECGRTVPLKKSAEKLDRVQCHFPWPVRSHASMGDVHLAIVAGDEPMIADGDADDVRGEITE
jgi:hypothetical protein